MAPFGAALTAVLAVAFALLAGRSLGAELDAGLPTAPERVPFLGGGVPEVVVLGIVAEPLLRSFSGSGLLPG